MAEKKALFKIEINGIQQSCDAVKSLNKELKELEGYVKSLQNAKIKVKVEGNTAAPDTKTKVTGNESTKDQSALAKLEQQIAQQRAKDEALVTEEYKKQYQELVRIKDQNKENEQLQKQIAQGVRDSNGEYTNSLQGLRAYLSDLQKQFNLQELGTEEWKKTQAELTRVRELVKGIEQSTGDYRRNVGNYPSGAKDLVVLFQQTQQQIKDANNELVKLNQQLANTQQGTQAYDDLKNQISQVEAGLAGATAEAKNLQSALNGKIGIEVGDSVRYFDNLKQAAKELNAELQQMTINGQTNTKEFNDTITALGKVRTAMSSVSSEVQSYIGNAKGLKDTVTIMQGLSSLASIGAGIQQLFGGQNEELDKSLKTFTSISLIMNGLGTIQQQINDKNNIWGQTLGTVWSALQKISGQYTGLNALSGSMTKISTIFDFENVEAKLQKTTDKIKTQIAESGKVASDEFKQAFLSMLPLIDDRIKVTAQEFERNLTDAISNIQSQITTLTQRLNTMKASPNVDTAAIKQLEQEIAVLQQQEKNLIQTQSEYNRSLISQGEAAQQAAASLAQLNQEQKIIEGASPRLVKKQQQLNNELGRLEQEAGTARTSMGKVTQTITGWGKSSTIARNGLNLLAKGIKGVATAIKGLLSATIILAVVQLLIEGITWLANKITDFVHGGDKLVENFDGIAASVDATRARMEEFNRTLERNKATLKDLNDQTKGYVDTAGSAMKKQQEEITKATNEAAEALRDYIRTLNDVKRLTNDYVSKEDWDDAWGFRGNVKNMEDFKKRYQLLVKAVSQGVDEMKAATGEGNWWQTASDAAASLAKMQKAIIHDIEAQINDIDFSKGEAAYREFINIINDEMNASALANIEDLFGDDKWQKGLKKRIDAYRDFAQQMYDINTNIMQNDQKLRDQIADNQAAAIRDSYQRGVAQRKLQEERELRDAEDNEELKASIRAKYATQAWEAQKSQNQKVLQLQYLAQQAEINLMAEGWQKQLAQLKLQEKQALDSARQQGASKKTLANITRYWNNQILKAEQEFTRQMFLAQRDRNRTMNDMWRQYDDTVREWTSKIAQRYADMMKNMSDNALEDMEFSLSFDLQGDLNTRDLDRYKKDIINYYGELEAAQLQHAERQYQLAVEEAEREFELQKQEQNNLIQDRTNYYDDWLQQENDASKARYDAGLISQEEYLRQTEENQEVANENLKSELAKLIEDMKSLEETHQHEMLQLQRDYNLERINIETEAGNNIRRVYDDLFSDIQKKMEANTKKNTRFGGIIDYKKERQNLKETKQEFENMLADLAKEYEKLRQQFENNEISFNDFKQAKQELDDLVQKTKDALKTVSADLGSLLQRTAQSAMQMAQQYVSAFSNLYSMISNMNEIALQQEEDKLDAEQELLDKEADMLEEAYNKQEEITRKHADKINEIEGNLSQARGDARDFLLDQLARERDAQLKSLEIENKIQKEKEKNAKKQEQLEKRQEQLEKKRWEQNKKNQVVQATINTFTAVTNALAVQPWFVGLALSAVALALGMANVAKIQAQHYYADGGLLGGPSHSRGGIPVGNTGIEVEGGEYVINKRTTRYNQPLIEYINSQRRPITREDIEDFYADKRRVSTKVSVAKMKFADGGAVPMNMDNNFTTQMQKMISDMAIQQSPVVSVVDIINATDRVNKVKTLAGLNQ